MDIMDDIEILGVILVIGGFVYILYLYGTWNYGRFTNTRVPYIKPVTLAGNIARFLLKLEDMVSNFGKPYVSFPDKRFVGLFHMRTPAVMIRDPDLIRQVGVKDFDYFVNHRSMIDEDADPLTGYNLINLKDQNWRDMRATLSPAFTGSKMRNMYSLVSECAQQMAEYLKKETDGKGSLLLEMRDLYTRCSNDVIASAAFGLQVDSLKDRTNLFYTMANRASNFTGFIMNLKFFGFQMMPKVMKILGVKLIDSKCSQFFRELVHGTMSVREREGIVRPDMIHLLMQARQGTLQHNNTNTTLTQQQDAGYATVTESDVGKAKKQVWTNDYLTAQALLFFLAGFETTAAALTFTTYELAINPEAQKRLQDEIDEIQKKLGPDDDIPNYEMINSMRYLDMVVTECLRIWPPAPFTERICSKPYVLEDYDGNKFQIKEGELIFFPIYNLHRDPKYYSNPDKFDPERFSDENKKNIKPFTYLPFGVGPRNCVEFRWI